MRLFGLLGYPLGHSFSAGFFAENFQAERQSQQMDYQNFALENVELMIDVIKQNPNLEGFNITIPYKEQIIPYLDDIDEGAKAIGAVNCVTIKGGKLKGYNTDAYGFENSLLKLIEGADKATLKALVLGTGGASKAIKYVLTKNGIEFKSISRDNTKADFSYDELTPELIKAHQLIINTTPLGTYPNNHTYPAIPYEGITVAHDLFDVVYNPALTRFLELGQNNGAKVLNGSQMLVDQAYKSWEIWGLEPQSLK